MRLKEITRQIERIAPLQLQEDYDNCGIQVADPETEVTKVLLCLDVTEETVEEAKEIGAQAIISHHPLIFRPIRKISPSDYISRTIIKAIRYGISIYAAHTNLDNAYNGVNYKIAEKLQLIDVKPLAPIPSERTEGLVDSSLCGSGIIGQMAEEMKAEEFIAWFKEVFKTTVTLNKEPEGLTIKRVAVCGGSGSEFIRAAERADADVYITGEIGYHHFFGHPEILLVEAGHYETEQYTMDLLKDIIGQTCEGVECVLSKTKNYRIIK